MDATLHDSPAGRNGTAVDTGDYPATPCDSQAGHKVVCAWCQKTIREGSAPISHGICAECYATVKADSPSLSTHIEGPCVECQETTEAVMLYGDKAAFLCVPCQQKIRTGV
jgi:hypothetical protein